MNTDPNTPDGRNNVRYLITRAADGYGMDTDALLEWCQEYLPALLDTLDDK